MKTEVSGMTELLATPSISNVFFSLIVHTKSENVLKTQEVFARHVSLTVSRLPRFISREIRTTSKRVSGKLDSSIY